MTRTLTILGSTGSIGTQTVDVVRQHGIRVAALTAGRNVSLLEEQARLLRPLFVALADPACARDLAVRLADTDIRVGGGSEGVLEAARMPEADTVLNAVVGTAGLLPTMAALERPCRLALANKETLVCAGDFVTARANEVGAEIIPVDSEHSAIFQCLAGSRGKQEVKKLILTASGGPFFGRSAEELRTVTVEEALRHPNWNMGAKVTVDSATLMNKGLELIEAMHLFGFPSDRIEIIVHRESIIHSMVEYIDHAVIAQLGTPDMRLPIQHALTWPERREGAGSALDFKTLGALTFAPPDPVRFPCLGIAMEAARAGGSRPAVMNAANEGAVSRFLRGEISFLGIGDLVAETMDRFGPRRCAGVEELLEVDREARNYALTRGRE